MRTDDNCKFKLHKTATCDWYAADEVDAHITELEQELAEANSIVVTTGREFEYLENRCYEICFERDDLKKQLAEAKEENKKLIILTRKLMG